MYSENPIFIIDFEVFSNILLKPSELNFKGNKGNLKKLVMGYFTLNKTTDYFSNWHLNEYFDSKLTNCILTIER